MTDLQAKYQRLATEYSKLRAQLPVLKKAVIDEKSIQDTLREELKEKEQSIRKSSQEIDSLTFRNEQLSKRVFFLQEELEVVKASKKKNKTKENNDVLPDQHTNVFTEELQSKIEENARLHKALDDSGVQYEQRIQELEQTVTKYESDSSTHQQALNNALTSNKSQVDKLLEDKAMLEVKLQSVESELKNSVIKTQHAESKLVSKTADLESKLAHTQQIVDTNLPFIDNCDKLLNSLNVPTHDRKHQIRAKELVQQSLVLLRDMMSALSNFFTYSEQRVRIYPHDGTTEPITATNIKLASHLHENSSYTRPVSQSLQCFLDSIVEDQLTILDTAVELPPLGIAFTNLVRYMERLHPYLILSLEEECAISSCPSSLEKKNRDVIVCIRRLFNAFCQTQTYVSIITTQAQTCRIQHPKNNYTDFFKKLAQSVSTVSDSARDLSKQYNSKVSLEHQLPTATQKLKTTDECVVSALVSLVTSVSKLSAFLSGNAQSFTEQAGYRTRGGSTTFDPGRCDPLVTQFRQQAGDYLAALQRPVAESIPYKIAVQNHRILLSSSESRDSIAHQLHTVQSQLSDLSQEKERFQLELQLLKIKYEREIEKNETLEKKLVGGMLYTDSIQANIDHTGRQDRTESMTSVGSGSGTSTANATDVGTLESGVTGKGDHDSREVLIRNHYTTRMNELIAQLQLADSKAVNFHAEVRALHKRLSLADKSKEQALEETKVASLSLSQITDELHTTNKSYESQLSMMSEHLAGMNDKLAEQKEEIDDLRSQLSTKGAKKILSGLKK